MLESNNFIACFLAVKQSIQWVLWISFFASNFLRNYVYLMNVFPRQLPVVNCIKHFSPFIRCVVVQWLCMVVVDLALPGNTALHFSLFIFYRSLTQNSTILVVSACFLCMVSSSQSHSTRNVYSSSTYIACYYQDLAAIGYDFDNNYS